MIFLNGRLVETSEAGFDPADRGLLLGDGLFETLLCLAGRPLDLEPHLARLTSGARSLGIPFAIPLDEMADAVAGLLNAEGLTQAPAALRITLTRGVGPRGLLPPKDCRPNLLITAQETTAASPAPARATIAKVRRNEHSPSANLKTLNYLDNVLARKEAEDRGADEAIMFNTAGKLCCGSASNVFLVFRNRLATPPISDGVLPGITRAQILALAPSMGVKIDERSLGLDDLQSARAVFLTNSLIGLRSVASVEARPCVDDEADRTIAAIKEAFARGRLA